MANKKSDAGFTMVEVTVVAAVMLVVLATLLGALDSLTNSSQRADALVTNEEAVRFGLDSLQRDLRAANPVDVQASTASYSSVAQVELGPNPGTRTYIRWYYDTNPASPTYEAVLRQTMSGPAANASVTYQTSVMTHVRNVESGVALFTYYDAKGNDLVAGNPNTPANVANCVIRIHVQVMADAVPGPQPFSENVDIELRNRLPGGIVGC